MVMERNLELKELKETQELQELLGNTWSLVVVM